LSRKRKAKRRLEQSRKKALLKTELRLVETEAALLKRERAIEAGRYEDSMIQLYRDANATQRVALEAEYQKVAGSGLKQAHEARIVAALQSQPCGDCDLSRAE
jgi:hypothetical protein